MDRIKLSQSELKKLNTNVGSKKEFSMSLTPKHFVKGNLEIKLTDKNLKDIKAGEPSIFKPSQFKQSDGNINGGALPLALIPALIGLATSAYSAYKTKKHQDNMLEESKKQTELQKKNVEGKGFYRRKPMQD